MNKKSYVIMGITVMILLISIGVTVAGASVVTVSPLHYITNGDHIGGWDWLRQPGNYTIWAFPQVPTRVIYLNFSMLCTNGFDGGSGYRDIITIEITQPGQPITYIERKVSLINPFQPKHADNTHGIGYEVYGSKKVTLKQDTPVTVTFRWPGRYEYHIATRKQSLKIAYIEKEGEGK